MPLKTPAELVKSWRQRRKLRQHELAALSGLSTATICRIEQGKRIDADSAMLLADATGFAFGSLYRRSR